jgi:hypothetical protein
MEKLTPSTALNEPNDLTRFFTSRMGRWFERTVMGALFNGLSTYCDHSSGQFVRAEHLLPNSKNRIIQRSSFSGV